MMTYKGHIEGLKKGSYKDFKFLYEEYSGNLSGFVYGLTKSKSRTKDIVQETFIRIWINKDNIDPDFSFKSYLFRIARNIIIDELRKQMNDPIFDNYIDHCETLRSKENEIEQKIDFDIFVQQLEKAKRKLTPRQLELFELNKEQGIPTPEIAEKLGISEQTIYNILSSAMQVLRKEIGISWILLFSIFFD